MSACRIQVAAVVPGNAKESETFRNVIFKDKLPESMLEGQETLQDVILWSTKRWHDKPFVGTQDTTGQYQYKSHIQIQTLAERFASYLLSHDCTVADQYRGRKQIFFSNFSLKIFGILSKNREEWLIAEQAAILYNLTLVALYDTLKADSLLHIIKETQMKTVVCSGILITKILDLYSPEFSIRTIISLDSISKDVIDALKECGITIIFFSDIISQQTKSYPLPVITKDSIYTLKYTSGTTGVPKAVVLTHKNIVSQIAGLHLFPSGMVTSTDRHLSYLPMAHIFERTYQLTCTYVGAEIAFYSGDIKNFRNDLQAARPTVLLGVPRIWNKLLTGVKEAFAQKGRFTGKLIEMALQAKLKNLPQVHHWLYDLLIFNKVKKILGGRVRAMLSGSAPVSKEDIDFLRVCFCADFAQGYGQTESGGSLFGNDTYHPVPDTVGFPMGNVEFKLVYNLRGQDEQDNGQTEYFDKKYSGRQAGEVWIRGPGIMLGYYKNDEATNEAIDKDGWYHTGDIGELVAPGNALKIIDRVKNMFKLSQGEYVIPEKQSPYVSDAFIEGDPFRSYGVAVVVAEEDMIRTLAPDDQKSATFKELCQNPDVIMNLQEALRALGQKANLNGYEIPKKIHIESQSFADLGLLTTTFKLQRHQARKMFAEQVKSLYEDDID